MSSDPREPDVRRGGRRPDWDEYFMLIAVATRQRAECLGRHVGAVLVREGRIVATGYNGTPRGFPLCNAEEQGCHRCAHREQYPSGSAYDVCICVHAEQNAILQAARLGYSPRGAHCYTTLRPGFGCLKELRQVGRGAHRLPQRLGAGRGAGARRARRAPGGAARGARDGDRAARPRPVRAPAQHGSVRRPPPIAGLFVLLAAGPTLIAVRARRGELKQMVPVGFVHDAQDRVILDPDAQVQASVRLFFETFQRTGSCLAVVKEFHAKGSCFHADYGAASTKASWSGPSCCTVVRGRSSTTHAMPVPSSSAAPNSAICPMARSARVWCQARNGFFARHASRLHCLGGVPIEPPAREDQCGRLEPRAVPWASTRRYGTAAGACDLWNLR